MNSLRSISFLTKSKNKNFAEAYQPTPLASMVLRNNTPELPPPPNEKSVVGLPFCNFPGLYIIRNPTTI